MHISQTASPDKTLLQQFLLCIEIGLAFTCMVMFSEGLLPRLFSTEYASDSSDILRKLWLPVYALVLVGCGLVALAGMLHPDTMRALGTLPEEDPQA